MNNLDSVTTVNFSLFPGDDGSFLTVYNHPSEIPFKIERMFVVQTLIKSNRGHHAHKACKQFFVCLKGACTVSVSDGVQTRRFELKDPRSGLLVPESLWAEQEYDPNTILMVFTDHPYDETDYIRNFDDFKKYRKLI